MSTFTEWQTPRQLFDPLNVLIGGFAVDCAAHQSNHLVDRWYGPGGEADNALEVPEWASPAWCNPPYGKGLDKWLDKFIEQSKLGVSVVALLPAYVERKWWYEKVVRAGTDIIFLVGRVPFEKPCDSCNSTGVATDENGVQHDDPCEACGGTGSVAGTQPRDPSAIVIYGPTSSGRSGWLDWKNRKEGSDGKIFSDGSSDSQGGSALQE